MVFHAAACLRSRQFLSHFFLSFSLVSRYIYSRAYQLSSFSEFFLILLHQVMPKHARVRITDAKLNMHLIIRQRLFACHEGTHTGDGIQSSLTSKLNCGFYTQFFLFSSLLCCCGCCLAWAGAHASLPHCAHKMHISLHITFECVLTSFMSRANDFIVRVHVYLR